MIADDLLRPQLSQYAGQVWACGSLGGLPQIEMSDDQGATKRITRRPVTSRQTSETPGLLASFDGALWAALVIDDAIKVHRSQTQGESLFEIFDTFD